MRTLLQMAVRQTRAATLGKAWLDLVPLGRSGASSQPACDIVVQVDNFAAGGLEKVVLDLNDALLRAGLNLVLLVLGQAGASVHHARERGMQVLVAAPTTQAYADLMRRLKPKLVLTHYSVHGADYRHDLGIPCVQVIHNIYMWFSEQERVAFAHASRMTAASIAVSEFARQYSIQRLGVDGGRCIVLPGGIAASTLAPRDAERARHKIRLQYGLGKKDFVFLSVGAINHQKNHLATIRAFAAASGALPHAHLVIVGPPYEPGLLQEVNQYVARHQLRDRVIYAGSAPTAEPYYAMADAFVSAAFFEGGPLSLLEAARANLPIVTTKVGLACQFRDLPGIHLLEPPIDIFQFRGAIGQLASNAEFEERLSTAMIKTFNDPQRPNLPPHIVRAFDKSEAYRHYVLLIKDVLAGHQISGGTSPVPWPREIEGLSRRAPLAST
jgi:glycosyltransferase involved in cell wall biosynthesis